MDECEPVPSSGDVDHAHGGFGELVVPRGDRASGLQSAEHAFGASKLLICSVLINLHAAVWSGRE